ncbi:MAG TPA: hypothetical protein IAA29_00700 [Candidatus Paenibacillus intestinavium]|nr:hypothetical protein [Candidatus Paenibacillus intestinavium]
MENLLKVDYINLYSQWEEELNIELQDLDDKQLALRKEIGELIYRLSVVNSAAQFLKKTNHVVSYEEKIGKPLREQLQQKELELEQFKNAKEEQRAHITALLDELKERRN